MIEKEPLIVGKLLRKKVRDFLNECKFRGFLEDYFEKKHFLESEFYLKGSKENLDMINKRIIEWYTNFVFFNIEKNEKE